MGWIIKEDAPSALDLYRVLGNDPNGQEVREHKTFLAGQEVPDSFVDHVVDRMDGDETDHLHAFLDHQGERAPRQPQQMLAPSAQSPHTGPPPVDYSQLTREQLDAEVARRQSEGRVVNITGTGANGNVKNSDVVAGLMADDEVRNNPFA